MVDFPDVLGFAGVFLMLYSYARVQLRREYVKTLAYSVGNFLGAVFLSISLYINWNFPSFVSNVIWAIVSGYGIYRCLKYMKRSVQAETPEIMSGQDK